MKDELEAAGFTEVRRVGRRWCTAVDPDGWPCAVLRQDAARWHWFSRDHAATASNGNAATCHKGGLGDAIDDDDSMRVYKQLMLNSVPEVVKNYQGVYAAGQQVVNEEG